MTQQALEVDVFEKLEELPELRSEWSRLAPPVVRYRDDFEDFRYLAERGEHEIRILRVRRDGEITALALFVLDSVRKAYSIGERRLFDLPAQVMVLYGETILGANDVAHVRAILSCLEGCANFDYVSVGEIALDSELCRSLEHLGARWFVSSPERKESLRWLVDLPPSFDDYLAGLSAKSRRSIKRRIRKFEERYDCELVVVEDESEIDRFLEWGERVSRMTYQWNVGQRLCNDAATRERYVSLAERGELRCYLAIIDERPVAFLRGTLKGPIYHYETPGFDPEFAKDSLGTVLLMYALRDLIEHTSCEAFDFGQGGDEAGYKATYGTRSYACRRFEIGRRFKPYSLLLFGCQSLLVAVKNGVNRVLKDGGLRKRLKRAIRQYG